MLYRCLFRYHFHMTCRKKRSTKTHAVKTILLLRLFHSLGSKVEKTDSRSKVPEVMAIAFLNKSDRLEIHSFLFETLIDFIPNNLRSFIIRQSCSKIVRKLRQSLFH